VSTEAAVHEDGRRTFGTVHAARRKEAERRFETTGSETAFLTHREHATDRFFFRRSLIDHLVQRAAEFRPVVIERVVVRNRREIAAPTRDALSVFFGEVLRFRAKPNALRVDLRDAGKTLPTAIEKDHVIRTDFHNQTG